MINFQNKIFWGIKYIRTGFAKKKKPSSNTQKVGLPELLIGMIGYNLLNLIPCGVIENMVCFVFFFQCPHMSLMDFVVSPPGCGRSVTDFLRLGLP
jgi:hypothetical protein